MTQSHGEKVLGSEGSLAKHTVDIETNQKHGLDQLTMFKKSQSEGLLRQFDKMEQRIEEEKLNIQEQMIATKGELETQCRYRRRRTPCHKGYFNLNGRPYKTF